MLTELKCILRLSDIGETKFISISLAKKNWVEYQRRKKWVSVLHNRTLFHPFNLWVLYKKIHYYSQFLIHHCDIIRSLFMQSTMKEFGSEELNSNQDDERVKGRHSSKNEINVWNQCLGENCVKSNVWWKILLFS